MKHFTFVSLLLFVSIPAIFGAAWAQNVDYVPGGVTVYSSRRNNNGDAMVVDAGNKTTRYTLLCNLDQPDCKPVIPGPNHSLGLLSSKDPRGKTYQGQNVLVDDEIVFSLVEVAPQYH